MPNIDLKLNGMKDIEDRQYIYVIGPDIGAKKIGITRDTRRRLSQYRTHNMGHVKILFQQNCTKARAQALEKDLHARLSEYRHHGEWFEADLKTILTEYRESALRIGQPPMQFAILDMRKLAGTPNSSRHYDYNPDTPMGHIQIYATDNLEIDNGTVMDPPVAMIYISQGDKCRLDFSAEGLVTSKWRFAPKEYQKDFKSISHAISYAENIVFTQLRNAKVI